MATATKRQTQGAQRRGSGQRQPAQASSQSPGQTRQIARHSQPRSHRDGDGRQQTGLDSFNEEKLARGLGWFSIGLGLAELLAPREIARIAGVKGKHTGLIRLFGLREIAHGIGIFAQDAQGQRPALAVWSRVVGDALDLAALGAAASSPGSNKGRVAFATANVLAVTALDMLCAQQLSSKNSTTAGGAMHVQKSITIERSPEELYQFWRNFENLPRFMYHLESVRVAGDGRSHWVAKAPLGTTVEWDAEIVEDRPAELIAWRSTEGADVENRGSVRFERATGGRGTIVRVELEYNPPAGVVGATVAKLLGEEPEGQVKDDLHRFKQVIETGEVVRSESSPEGIGQMPTHPGQPPSAEAAGR
ncbi:MAG TPA: SRPBCC family protein [Pyrinomonadaceae bacterium]|nr:SRPBCC family protein [Pyrinomonadaceae bacterium]